MPRLPRPGSLQHTYDTHVLYMECRVYVHDACAAISGHISRVVLYFVQTSWVYDAVNMRLVCASVCMRAAVCRRVSHVLAVHVVACVERG